MNQGMGFANLEHNSKQNYRWIAEEARLRESLAAYFLSVSSLAGTSEIKRKQIRRAQHRLFELETVSILQAARMRRSLRYGDLGLLLSVTLEAVCRKLENSGSTIQYTVPEQQICTAAEPRIIQMALVRLLHAAVVCTPIQPVTVRVMLHPHSVNVSMNCPCSIHDAKALALVQVAARLHKGGVMVSDGVVAFSFRRQMTAAVGLFAVPSIQEMLDDTLSIVNIGFA